MAILDLDKLLAPVSDDAPSGEDPTVDTAYYELDGIFKPPQEGLFESAEAEEPRWLDVANRATKLFETGKELRLAVYLAIATMKTEGFEGLRDGLALLNGLIESFWDSVYPQLDPDDDNDPMERVNILASIAQAEGAFQDPILFIRRIAELPLCATRQFGPLSLRHVRRSASGEPSAEGEEEALAPEQIAGVFRDADVEALQATLQALQEAHQLVTKLDANLELKVGAGAAADFTSLKDVIAEAGKVVQEHLGGPGGEEEGGGEGGGEEEGGGEGGGEAGRRRGPSGEIRSPQDVLLALDRICRYYSEAEPSSPVPLVLRRAQGLVAKSFAAIIRDLTPGSADQLEGIFGFNTINEQEQ